MTDNETHPQQPTGKRAKRRWWLYLLVGPPLALLVAIVALVVFLRTDHGLQRVESLLNSTLSDVGGQRIVLSGLHGRFPFDLRLDGLRLSDADGNWLEIDALVLRWSGRDLLSARLRVTELSARRLELIRPPLAEAKDPKPGEPFQGVDLPETFPQVAVERLAVEKIVLTESLAGQRTVLRLDADANAGRHGLDANLRLETLKGPVEGPAGLLTLRVGYTPSQDILNLAARFEDPQGNLAPLLGLPEATPLHLLLAGDGPAGAWSGELAAQVGDLVTVDSYLTLELQEKSTLHWTGQVLVAPDLMPEPVPAYLPQTKFEVFLSLPEPNLLRLERIHLENPRLRAHLLADLDLDKAEVLGGRLVVEVADTTPLNALLDMDLGPSIQLNAEASGPLAGPDIRLALALQKITAGPARIGPLELNADTRFERGADLVIGVTGSVQAQGLEMPDIGLPEALAESLNLGFDLAFHQTGSLLALHSLHLRGHDLEALAEAELDLGQMRLAGKVRLMPMDIHPWLTAHDLDYQGAVSMDIATKGTLQPLDLAVDVQAALEAQNALPDPLPAILGETVALNATILLSSPAEDSQVPGQDPSLGPSLPLIQARNVSLRAEALQVDAKAQFCPETKLLDAFARLELPDLGRAAPALDFDLAGSLFLEARAQGQVDNNLALEAVLSSDDLAVAGLDPFPLHVALHADSLADAPAGNISISTSPMNTPLAARTGFALTEEVFHVSEFLLSLPQGRLTGHGHVDLDSRMVTAQVQGHVADIAPLARLAGQDMHGTLDIQARVSPDSPRSSGSPGADRLNAFLHLDLTRFKADFGDLHSLSVKVEARDLPADPGLDADIALQGFHSGQTRVNTFTAKAQGTPRKLAVTASTQGHALHPFNLDVRAAFEDNAPARIVRVQDIAGVWAGQRLSLPEAVIITTAENDLAVSPLLMEFGQALIRGQAKLAKHEADLRLGVEKLPLDLFTEAAQGTLTAGIALSGPKSALAGHITILGQDLSPRIPQVDDSMAVDLHAEAELHAQGLTFEAALRRNGDQAPLLQAGGRTALRVALEPAGVELPEDAPVSAFAKGELDLLWLGEMLLPETQYLAGALNLDLTLAGTLAEPKPSGRAEILDASYQHLQQGVLLRNIDALATLEQDQVRLHELTATDIDQGKLRVQGQAELVPDKNFPFHFTIQAADLNILDSPLATARLADVSLDVSGSATAQEIKGHLAFDRVEVFVRDLGGPQVAELHVIEIHDSDAPAVLGEPIPRSAPPAVTLDVDVRFPARVFVRGRGLDSEWGGGLHVSGNAARPALRGEIKPIRGRLDMLGKRFTLSRESVIQFVGDYPPAPFVNIQAEQQGKEHMFFLIISGIPPDIEIRPEAEPPLPEDEVLSQMLFSRSMSNITPVQAAKLALAVRELAGHGAGPDIMGAARDILLLDDLDIVSQEGGEMGLRAGKYVNERVYMRLESDLKTGEEQVSADVELTPRINLESRIGPKGGGLGLFWRHDY
ncbi:MAG TPA: hypothetical protein ENN39_06005 [Desulfonatronum sp.]|nr:hypothetical protein [Desulfonatronum sp.]